MPRSRSRRATIAETVVLPLPSIPSNATNSEVMGGGTWMIACEIRASKHAAELGVQNDAGLLAEEQVLLGHTGHFRFELETQALVEQERHTRGALEAVIGVDVQVRVDEGSGHK